MHFNERFRKRQAKAGSVVISRQAVFYLAELGKRGFDTFFIHANAIVYYADYQFSLGAQ